MDDVLADERSVLLERARALARPLADDASAWVGEAGEQHIVLRAAGERWAVPARSVMEVFRTTELAQLPGAEPPVVALAEHRGELLLVLDATGATPDDGIPDGAGLVLVLSEGDARAGLLVEELLEMIPLPSTGIHAAGDRAVLPLRGVTSEGVGVLDVRALTRAQP